MMVSRAKIYLSLTRVASQLSAWNLCNKTLKTLPNCNDPQSCLSKRRVWVLTKIRHLKNQTLILTLRRWVVAWRTEIQIWAKVRNPLPKRRSIVRCSIAFSEKVAKIVKLSNFRTSCNKSTPLTDSSDRLPLKTKSLPSPRRQTICHWTWSTSLRTMQSCSREGRLTCSQRSRFRERFLNTRTFCQNSTVSTLQGPFNAKWDWQMRKLTPQSIAATIREGVVAKLLCKTKHKLTQMRWTLAQTIRLSAISN